MSPLVQEDENPLITKFLQDLVEVPMVEVPGSSKGILGKRIIKVFETNSENYVSKRV